MKRGFFKRKDRAVPGLNTSSLPDLIFTVLFFFMIVTHMRDVELKVKYQVPQGKELKKQEHKGAVATVYIGKPNTSLHEGENSSNGDNRKNNPKAEYVIQLNNEIASIGDIKAFIERERAKMNEEDRERMTVCIKADKDVPMGMIIDVKKELQKAYALRISYSASEQ